MAAAEAATVAVGEEGEEEGKAAALCPTHLMSRLLCPALCTARSARCPPSPLPIMSAPPPPRLVLRSSLFAVGRLSPPVATSVASRSLLHPVLRRTTGWDGHLSCGRRGSLELVTVTVGRGLRLIMP